MQYFEQYKKLIFWVLISLVVVYLIQRLVKSIKYSASKEADVKKENLTKSKSFYSGVALGLFNAFDGIMQSTSQKEYALNSINELNDDEFIYTYNIFNANYTSGSDTLTTWVQNEIVALIFDGSKNKYLSRAKKLGLG